MKTQVLKIVAVSCLGLFLVLEKAECKKSSNRNSDDNAGEENNQKPNNRLPPYINNIDSDRSKIFDPETSAQAINPSTLQNPLLYQNQGGFANLGGGVFGNQAAANGYSTNPYLTGAGGFGGINPYLQQQGFGGQGFGGQGFGGIGGAGYGGLGGGFGGAFGGLGGVAPDIYTQGALAAQLYNNPLYGAGAGSLSGAAAGINPLLLRGAQNTQYPVVGGLGAYNPYLAAQALLSPYSNYNSLYNYPFSSRFGIGAGNTGRSGLGRFGSQSSSNTNDDK